MTEKQPKLKQWLSTALKLVIAAGLIYWLVQRGSLDFRFLGSLLTAHPFYLFICVLMLFINLYLNNWRWVMLMRGQGFVLGIKETLPLSFIGMFFNYAMPGGVGGDLVKGYYITQGFPKRRTAAATSVLMDRLVGFVGMILMSMVAILIKFDMIVSRHELKLIAVAVTALFFVFAAFFAFAFSRRVYHHPLVDKVLSKLPAEKSIRKIYEAVHSYRSAPRYFWYSCALTVASQSFMLLFFILIGNALEIENVPPIMYAFVIPLGLIVTAIPIAPAGIGVGQASFLVLFNWALGHESRLGPTLVTAHQLISFLLGLVGAYFYFRRKGPKFEKEFEGDPDNNSRNLNSKNRPKDLNQMAAKA